MKKLLHLHPNFVIGTLAAVFLGILVIFYLWATGNAFTELRLSLATPVSQTIGSFNLAGAAKLDLRGLVVGTSTVPSASSVSPSFAPSAPASVAAPTTTIATTTIAPTTPPASATHP